MRKGCRAEGLARCLAPGEQFALKGKGWSLDTPSSLVATAISSDAIAVSWADTNNGESGYSIERSLDPTGGFGEIAVADSNETTYRDTQLASATAYHYRVRVFRARKNRQLFSGYSTVASVTTLEEDTSAPSVSIPSPASGTTYSGPQAETLMATASDDVGVVQVEFYDGDVLRGTDTSSPYSLRWMITSAENGSHSWTAKAFDAAGNIGVSSVVDLVVSIGDVDGEAPSVSFTGPLPGSRYSAPQTVTIAAMASDNVAVTKVEFYHGGVLSGTDRNAPYTHPWAIASADNGPHAWTAKAYDAAGNTATTTVLSLTVDIRDADTEAPSVAITSPSAGTTYTSAQTVMITATASDDVGVARVEFYEGGALKGTDASAPYRYSWVITTAQNGVHSWTAKAYDVAGNVRTSSAISLLVDIPVPDTTLPSVGITSPLSGTRLTTAQTVAIAAAASDNVGVTRVEFYEGGALKGTDTSAPYRYGWVITTAQNGVHSWTAKAYDAAGNTRTSSAVTLTVDIQGPDTEAPSVVTTSPASGARYTSAQTVTIAATASDNVGVTKVEFYDDDVLQGTDTAPPYRYSWAIAEAQNGTHTWTAKAYDAAGNIGTSSPMSLLVNIPVPDAIAPIVSIGSPASGMVYATAQTVTMVATASDNVGVTKVEFYDDGTLASTDMSAPYDYSWAITAAQNGVHHWTAKAYDAAGNSGISSAVSLTVRIDNTAPTVSISSPASGQTYTSAQTVTVAATASDDVGVVRVEFYDAGALKKTDTSAPYLYGWSITAAQNGPHSWTAKAYDAAGNSRTSGAVSLTVSIDTTAPTVSINSPASGAAYTSAQTVTIAAAASDNVAVTKVEFYDAGALKGADTSAPYRYSWSITTAQNGSHSWTAKAYDAAGNTTVSSPVSLSVSIGSVEDVELLSFIPAAGTARDIALDPAAGYAYVASDEFGLTVVDVTNPSNPVATGAAVPPFTGGNIAVDGALAVVTSADGLFVVDVSDPLAPATIGSIDGKIMGGVAIAGSFAFARVNIPGNPSHTDLAVVDLSVPEAPRIVTQVSLPGGDEVEVVGSIAYVTTPTELKIFDVRNPRAPVLWGTVEIPNGARELAVGNGYAYVGNLSTVYVIDVRTPTAPAIVGSLRAAPTELTVAGNRLYLLIGSLLGVVDVSDPRAPAVLGTGEGFDAWGIEVAGTTAFLASPAVEFREQAGGLYVVDVSVPAAPGVIGQLPAGVGNSAIAVAGAVAVLGSDDGMRIVDVSDPLVPVTIGFLDVTVVGLAMAGDFAYARVNVSGNPSHTDLAVVDLRTPEAPRIVKQVFLPGGDEVEVTGSLIYVTTLTELKIFDVSNPLMPALVSSMRIPDGAGELAVGNGYAYVGNASRVYIVDVRIPSAPFIVGSLGAAPVDLASAGSRLYLVIGSILGIVDVSNPTAPELLGTGDAFAAWGIEVVGTTVFLASPFSGVHVTDAADPVRPQVLQRIRLPGPVRSITAAADLLYVGDDTATLDILSMGWP